MKQTLFSLFHPQTGDKNFFSGNKDKVAPPLVFVYLNADIHVIFLPYQMCFVICQRKVFPLGFHVTMFLYVDVPVGLLQTSFLSGCEGTVSETRTGGPAGSDAKLQSHTALRGEM